MSQKIAITLEFDGTHLQETKKCKPVDIGTISIENTIDGETEVYRSNLSLVPPKGIQPEDVPDVPEGVFIPLQDVFVHIAQRDEMQVTVTTKLDEIKEGIEDRFFE